MPEPLLCLICAMDKNRLIGSNNALPWHLPADLAFFKATTMGKPIIMGRKTYESIGRPLPGRQNIIVSRNTSYRAVGCDVVPGIREALAISQSTDEAMIIGGASLYEQAIDSADTIHLTLIHHEFDGDTWFPELDLKIWACADREDFAADEQNPYAWSFVKYVREIPKSLE